MSKNKEKPSQMVTHLQGSYGFALRVLNNYNTTNTHLQGGNLHE